MNINSLNKEEREKFQQRVQEYANNSWMQLGDTSKIVTENNPLYPTNEWEANNPMLHIIEVMSNPKYFAFTCEHLFNVKLLPFQTVILQQLWSHPFPMLLGTRGLGKSFLLAIYCLLVVLFQTKVKIVVTASAFRQARHVYDYCDTIWRQSPMLRHLLSSSPSNGPHVSNDRCTFMADDNKISFLPMGNGSKVRGERASHLIAEEFGSIPIQIFEQVFSGFSAVSTNPVQAVMDASYKKVMQELNLWTEEDEKLELMKKRSNQTIVCGTPDYDFKSFGQYWKRYKQVIESEGKEEKLNRIFNGEIPEGFSHKDWLAIRIPFDMLPDDYMDRKTIGKQKATLHTSLFRMEYGAIFPSDSDGFFKRSLIESCVCGNTEFPIVKKSCGTIDFHADLVGHQQRQYIYGVDPASEVDNFAITILEIWPDHRRIVYCWTVNNAKHKAKLSKGLVKEHDFYKYCARKIRDLMKEFPPLKILVDAGGGGIAIREALREPSNLEVGSNEQLIYEIIDEEKEKQTDNLEGLHILEMVSFSDGKWVSEANHGMKKDMEDTTLVFPCFDAPALGLAAERDLASGRVVSFDEQADKIYDTLEDCMLEVEELKDELSSIVISATQSGREHWDTQAEKTSEGKKIRRRKDRYSALLMANMGARQLLWNPSSVIETDGHGGVARDLANNRKVAVKDTYSGPSWFTERANQLVEAYGVPE